jgi:hypothetical protein
MKIAQVWLLLSGTLMTTPLYFSDRLLFFRILSMIGKIELL